MATKINMDRYVWEGWTVGAFIRELAPAVYYDLSGRRVKRPSKGIYIQQGRKVMVK